LAAGIVALLFMGMFLGSYHRGVALSSYYGLVGWHSHEMVFGYVVAVIAGFLLTAVRNWTGIQTLSGYPLAGLLCLWLLGRVLSLLDGMVPAVLIAAVDLSFIPALMLALAIPLWRSGSKKNFIFLALLTVMLLANALVHGELLHLSNDTAVLGIHLALYMVFLLIVIMAGRVVPFFIERGADVVLARKPVLDQLAVASVVVLAVIQFLPVNQIIICSLALLALLIHSARLFYWHHKKLWSVPLLWVLYLGYAWLVLGLFLKSLEVIGWVNPVTAIHAYTAGLIGVMTLGMMARVALGHSGRPLVVSRAMVYAFALVNMAALVRVVLPLLLPDLTRHFITVAVILWMAAFGIFVLIYFPVLTRPRVDGRPG